MEHSRDFVSFVSACVDRDWAAPSELGHVARRCSPMALRSSWPRSRASSGRSWAGRRGRDRERSTMAGASSWAARSPGAAVVALLGAGRGAARVPASSARTSPRPRRWPGPAVGSLAWPRASSARSARPVPGWPAASRPCSPMTAAMPRVLRALPRSWTVTRAPGAWRARRWPAGRGAARAGPALLAQVRALDAGAALDDGQRFEPVPVPGRALDAGAAVDHRALLAPWPALGSLACILRPCSYSPGRNSSPASGAARVPPGRWPGARSWARVRRCSCARTLAQGIERARRAHRASPGPCPCERPDWARASR
jgi:hypothetical protein